MTDADTVLARAETALQRHGMGQRLAQRASAARRRSFVRRLGYLAWAALAIVLAMTITGLLVPIGTTGVMIGALVFLMAALVIMMLPGERLPDAAALPRTALANLPLSTEAWLSSQRAALPAPAQRLVDGIGTKLEALSPQLASLDEREPAAVAIRRLLAYELPQLISGYARVPAGLRRDGLDGLAPDKQLLDGLAVVDGELARMNEQLARGNVAALATQGKYLELKYRGEALGE